jgi:hypothetical protein
MDTPLTPENIQHFIDSLKNPKDRLTPWELDFLESVNDQFMQRGVITQKQFSVLERIYTERT